MCFKTLNKLKTFKTKKSSTTEIYKTHHNISFFFKVVIRTGTPEDDTEIAIQCNYKIESYNCKIILLSLIIMRFNLIVL